MGSNGIILHPVMASRPPRPTTVVQPHTIVETDYDYGQEAEADDCARR